MAERDEIELILRAQANDGEAKACLIAGYEKLILSLAGRIGGGSGYYDWRELFQAGVLGLLSAVARYDLLSGVQLSTYAFPWIVGEMRRQMRKARDPFGIYPKLQRIKAAQETIEKKYNRQAAIDEIADTASIDREEAARIIMLAHHLTDYGEDTYRTLSSGGEQSDLLERIDLRSAIDNLPEEDKRIIALRYFCERTQKETAEITGKSQTTISRIERHALDALKETLLR